MIFMAFFCGFVILSGSDSPKARKLNRITTLTQIHHHWQQKQQDPKCSDNSTIGLHMAYNLTTYMYMYSNTK